MNQPAIPAQPASLLQCCVTWLQRTLILWLLASSLLAYCWTGWLSIEFDPFSKEFFTNNYLFVTIAVTMFGIGMMLPRDEVQQLARRWPSVLLGTGVQYTTMPMLAYGIGKLAGLHDAGLVGVIMVGCVPGAMASNVLTLNAGGNTSYSVSLTTTATLLSPLAVPTVLGLTLAAEGKIDRSILISSSVMLLWTVVVPVVVGHLIGRMQQERFQLIIRQVGTILANLAILLIIAVVVGRNRHFLAASQWGLVLVLLLINLTGYLAGYVSGKVAKLPEAMRRALTLEVGMQNAGLGATLALALFPTQPQVAIAPAMYTFGCMLTGTILAGIWSALPVQRAAHNAIMF